MFDEHSLDRRALLRALGAVGLTVGLGGSTAFLAACKAGGGELPSADDAVPSADSATRTLRQSVAADLPSYDPYAIGADSYPLIRNMYEALVEYDHDGKPLLRLAESYDIAPDQTSVSVKIRSGVTFHNGRPLTAHEVVANYQLVADPKLGGLLTQIAGDVAHLEATDDRTVKFTFKGPRASQLITDVMNAVPIAWPSNSANIANTGIGTGPFKQGDRVPGQSWSLTRNDQYWGKKADLAGLNFQVITDPSVGVTALQSNQLDVVGSAPFSTIPQLKASFRRVDNPITAGTVVFYLNAAKAPLDNEDVRQAFRYAIDRATIVRNALFGEAKEKVLFWPPTSPAYDPELEKSEGFNLERARSKFASAGVTSLPDPILVPSSLPELQAAAEIVQASLAGIGIKVGVRSVGIPEYLQELTGGTSGIYILTIGNENKYPTLLTKTTFFSTADNVLFPGGKTPEYYTSAVDAATNAVSLDQQKAAFKNLNQALLRLSSTISVSSHPPLMYYANNVHKVDVNIDAEPYYGEAFFS
ncbi:ABC transporter substrate-binding protein [Amycolatopsis acidicola]|nr:ABC transporter substrate-binding protein [Amycolatopsis acidicola]